MGRQFRLPHLNLNSPPLPEPSSPRLGHDPIRSSLPSDLASPFGKLDGLDRYDFREAAYEVFFTACRSSPGFGGRSALTYYNSSSDGGEGNGSTPGSPVRPPGVGMAVTSRVKNALGLKMLKKSPSSRRSSSCGSNPSSPSASGSGSGSSPRVGFTVPQGGKLRRPLTSAEIMRQQMKVTEQSDNRLRKTLMRTLVGQMGRRAETIILPLELLRHLKPSEFNDPHEYHLWQKRQFRILEAGLLLHPSIPLEKSDASAVKFREIIESGEMKPIDTGKNSVVMKTLCNCVVALAWRSPDGGTTDDETLVLDEIDELLELMKKTWSTLGINRPIHNLCFTWVLFEQYVVTREVEPDLLGASFVMLTEVATDAKKPDREPIYMKMLASVLNVMKKWCDKRLLDYHRNFNRETVGLMENMLPLLFSATKILEEDVPYYVNSLQEKGDAGEEPTGNRVDLYVRSSLRNAFAQMLEDLNINGTKTSEPQEVSEVLIKVARKTEELGVKERDIFSPILKKWHPVAAGVAAVTLHTCYGTLLKQYLTSKSSLNETVLVLQRAGKLEKALVQLVVEDSVECEDGGKMIVREMVPYEVDALIVRLMKQWIQERLQKGKEYILRAKQTETWNPKSKTEPYAHSAAEIVSFVKEAMENFFEIPINVSETLFYDLIDGLENVFVDYITFVASCGSKQSYIPTLPPLTRCSRDSKFFKLWKKAACNIGTEDPNQSTSNEGNQVRPSTSRGTQRLYIRLNTLYYLTAQLNSLDKALSISPKVTSIKGRFANRKQPVTSYFEQSLSTLQIASQHVSEVAAYRLIFLDSNSVFYGSLYVGDVASARIRPAVRILKQNLTLLCAIVTDRAQRLAIKEVMKASFEAFLMVLLAGGSTRVFSRLDHPMLEEDFESLKRVFCTCAEGLIVEDMVELEAEVVEGVVVLMGQTTEQLVEDFSSVASDACVIGGVSTGRKLPMPPTTGKWNRSDPNTVLRVLCSRNDRVASHFLKKTFQLAKRRPTIKMI
ncbi:UNVERIFIED_CONTAM: protein unc-13 [Sesamum calycinum]|uniref:Protein unc-13 n=1 Tax=Sesamum calycinum TaxID=2727403 RepID=A0AAW2QKN3_9LAMI